MGTSRTQPDPRRGSFLGPGALASFGVGVLFALGLGISGMTRPEKVLAFLDLIGGWDPSLALVMASALIVYGVAYRRITTRLPRPLLRERFSLPTRRDITPRLLFGAALFGAGWGLLGLCPGPAITGAVTLDPRLLTFVLAMLGGMLAFNVAESR